MNSSFPSDDVTNNSSTVGSSGDNNNSTGGSSGGNNNSTGEGDSNQPKKDTDYLYEYLKQFESKKLKDANLNLRQRHAPENATIKEKYLVELSRIFFNVRKENSGFFSYRDFETPNNMYLTNDFLNKILNLKKDYFG